MPLVGRPPRLNSSKPTHSASMQCELGLRYYMCSHYYNVICQLHNYMINKFMMARFDNIALINTKFIWNGTVCFVFKVHVKQFRVMCIKLSVIGLPFYSKPQIFYLCVSLVHRLRFRSQFNADISTICMFCNSLHQLPRHINKSINCVPNFKYKTNVVFPYTVIRSLK